VIHYKVQIYNRHARSNDFYFVKKNQMVKIEMVNEIFGGSVTMLVYLFF